MELSVHRHERIIAPVRLVWEEMDSLDQILAKTPQVSEFDIVPGGKKARGVARRAWGPVKWTTDLEIEITEIIPQQHLSFCIEGPALEVHQITSLDLTAVGENETKLEYRSQLEVRHRMASRMKGLFNEISEDHAHSLINRVKIKAEQRRLAQERLLK